MRPRKEKVTVTALPAEPSPDIEDVVARDADTVHRDQGDGFFPVGKDDRAHVKRIVNGRRFASRSAVPGQPDRFLFQIRGNIRLSGRGASG